MHSDELTTTSGSLFCSCFSVQGASDESLKQAQKLDFDEGVSIIEKFVTEKAVG